MPENRRPDTLTIIAIAIVASAIADVLHEAVGHGGACVVCGLHPLALSTVHFECSFDSRLVDAGGTLVNLIAGTISCFVARAVTLPRARLFWWLLMTFNLLAAGGYFLFSGTANIGDWAQFIQGLQPSWAWHLLLIAIGVVSYSFFAWLSLRALQPLLAPDQATRLSRARRYLLIPYFTSGTLHTIAGLFNPVGMILVAISAMAGSFGGSSAMLWMGSVLRGKLIQAPQQEGELVERSKVWIAVAAVVAMVFVVVLGRGLRF